MRFGRRAAQVDDADVCIDLRERLAPYTSADETPEDGALEPAFTALSPRQRPLQATTYQPRHLAP